MSPSRARPSHLSQVRDLLVDSDFTDSGLAARLSPGALAALQIDIPTLAGLELQHATDPQAMLIRTFQLAEQIPRSDWIGSLGDSAFDLMSEAGLVAGTQGCVRASLGLDPIPGQEPLYLVHDLGRPDRVDHVLGLGGAGATLARITPRVGCDRALDLGCGSGIQTLLAAQHAQHVVATDTNPRALHLTAMSAALSGLSQERVDLRQGSLFEPVAGQDFDLVVANPPFVIAPRPQFTYRDAGLPGDQLSREVVRGAAIHLAPGGSAAILVNWLLGPDQLWSARVADWLSDSAVSAWIVVRQVSSVLDYSLLWLRDAGIDPHGEAGPAAQSQLAAWLEYFATMSARAVCSGWVILHRGTVPGSAPWLLAEDLAGADRLPEGTEVADFLTACQRVEQRGVAEMLALPARLAPGTQISWDSTVGTAGVPGPTGPARLSCPGRVGPGGWRPAVQVDQAVLSALLGPGHLGIGERIDAAAEQLGLDPLDILPAALFSLRELDRSGLLAGMAG